MGTQRAGDGDSKPGIHIGTKDAKIAKQLGLEDQSPSTVYTDSLKARKKYEKLKEQDIKQARKEIIQIFQRIEERHDVKRAELIGDFL